VAFSEQSPDPGTESSDVPDNRAGSLLQNIIRGLSRINLLPRLILSAMRRLWPLIHAPRIGRSGGLQLLGIVAILFLGVATIGPPWNLSKRFILIYLFVAIGVAVVVIPLWRIPRERYSALFASIFGWVPVTLGALSYPFWYLYASAYQGDIGGEFFHAAADILPILLLATVIDVRRTNELSGKQLVPPIAAVFFGELAALNALAFTDSSMVANFAAVSSSLVTATFALIIAVMADVSQTNESPERNESRPAEAREIEPMTTNSASAPEATPAGTSAETGCSSGHGTHLA